jgi:hypothetical protein
MATRLAFGVGFVIDGNAHLDRSYWDKFIIAKSIDIIYVLD